jgi:hypothetical protein
MLGATWIIISAIFVLSFSTISSAMTSYSSDIEPSILVNESNSLSIGSLYTVRYIIRDGGRIGKTADCVVPYSDQAGLLHVDGMASAPIPIIAL